MEENRALREQVDQQLTTQDRLTSYVDLLRGFVVALTAELDESNQQMKMSSELFSKQSEEFEHLAAQLQNATEQLGALHMMKLSSTSVQVEPPKKKKSRCIFANILCGK